MTAVTLQQFIARLKGGVKRKPRHAPAAPGRDAILGRTRDDQSRFAKLLNETTGDDPDDSRMPLGVADHNRWVVTVVALHELPGLLRDSTFDGLSLAVLSFEELCKLRRLARRSGGEQFDGKPRATKPARGVQPRSEFVSDILGRYRGVFVHSCCIQEGTKPERRPRADPLQTVFDEDAILVAKRYDVRDQPQCGETNRVQQQFAQLGGNSLELLPAGRWPRQV